MHLVRAAVVACVLAGSAAWAAGEVAGKPSAGPDAKLEALGAARMRVMARLNALPPCTDPALNGLQPISTSINQIYQRTQQAIAKQIQDESAKAPEIRNQFLIDDLNARSQKLGEMWATYQNKEWPSITQRLGALAQTSQSLSQIVSTLTGLDGYWLRSNLDADVLTATFVALEKKADEIKTQSAALVAEAAKIAADWEAAWKQP